MFTCLVRKLETNLHHSSYMYRYFWA